MTDTPRHEIETMLQEQRKFFGFQQPKSDCKHSNMDRPAC